MMNQVKTKRSQQPTSEAMEIENDHPATLDDSGVRFTTRTNGEEEGPIEILQAFPRSFESSSQVMPPKNRNEYITLLSILSDENGLSMDGFMLSVGIFDRALLKEIPPSEILCAVCIVLAGKIEEVYPPRNTEIASKRRMAIDALVDMEMQVLKALDFSVMTRTIWPFLLILINIAHLKPLEVVLSTYFAELIVASSEFLYYPPSLMAATCVYTTRLFLKGQREDGMWTRELEKASGYREEHMFYLIRRMQVVYTQAIAQRTHFFKKHTSRPFRVSELDFRKIRFPAVTPATVKIVHGFGE